MNLSVKMSSSLDTEKIYFNIPSLEAALQGKKTVATVGFFDGVHRGHQELLQRLSMEAQKREALSLVVTFAEHPLRVLRKDPKQWPRRLCTPERKRELLLLQGVDILLELDFTPELAALSGKAFARMLKEHCGCQALIMGYDNKLGSKRFQSSEETEAYIRSWAIPVLRHHVLVEGDCIISSSVIRAAVGAANFSLATRLLGRPFSIESIVEHGQKRRLAESDIAS